MHSICKIPALIVRMVFVLVLLAGSLLLLPRQAMDFTNSHAQPQEQSRIVSRKPWRVEPVKVVAARNKQKEKIDIDKSFDDDDDWLDGFTVTVVNNSDKTVTAMNVAIVFRREPGDSRPPAVMSLYFGPSPSSLEYLRRDPHKVIKPGKAAELTLSPENYESLIRLLQQAGYPASIKRVELEISEVGFEDGGVLQAGTLFLPDPKHPNDPTKKIREDKRFQHHRPDVLPRNDLNEAIPVSVISHPQPVSQRKE